MQKHIKALFICFLLAMMVSSCKKEGSIQTYFVDHQELPNYTVIDLSPKMIDISNLEFTNEQKEAFNSLKKINFLGYRSENDDLASYNKALEGAIAIFKGEQYEELMEFKTDGIKFRINAEATEDAIDEILVLASTEDKGFGFIRVLGDNMKPEKMVKLIDELQKAEVDENQLKGIIDFFK